MAKEDKKESEELRDLRRQEAEITREIIDLREKLVALSKSDSANLREVQKVQESLLGLEKQKQGVQGQLYNQYGEILKSEQTHLDSMQKIVESQEDLLELTEETNEEYKKARAVKMELLDLEDELKTKYDDIQKDLSETIKSSQEFNVVTDLIAQTTAAVQERVHGTSKEMIALGDATRKSLYTNIDLVDTLQDMDASAKAVREGKFIELSSYREQLALKKTDRTLDLLKEDFERGSVKDAAGKTKYSQQDLDFLQKQMGIYTTQKTTLNNIISLKQKSNEENKQDAATQAEIIQRTEELKGAIGETHFGKIFDGLESGIKKIPGGAALSKVLGFDTFKKNIQENVGKSLTGIATGFQGGMVSGMKASGQAVMGFGKALLMGPQAVIFGLLAAVGALVGLFLSLDGGVSEVQKELGGTKKEALAAHEAAHDMASEMGLVGVNTEQVVKGMKTVSNIMGGIDVKKMMQIPSMANTVKDATLLSEKFGLAEDEIANVHTLSILSGKSMATLSGEAIQVAGGIMSSKNAVKLLAGVSKEVAVGFKGSTKELIAAAAKAKLLGTELGKMKEVGRGMLDIESSLGAEMEARVLTGKNINFDKARALALEGKTGELQDEILDQMGSMAEFKEMNVLQQESMAKAFGMSIEDMTTMLTKAEEMKTLGLDTQLQEDLKNATAEERSKIYATQAEKLKAQGKGEAAQIALQRAADEEQASAAEKFGDIMTKVKEVLTKLATPILEMVHGLLEGASAGGGMMEVFDDIVHSVKPIVTILVGIVKIILGGMIPAFKFTLGLISFMIQPLSWIASLFGSVEEKTEEVGKTVKGVSDGVHNITKPVKAVESGFGGVLKLVGLIGAAFAAKALIGSGLSLMKDKAMDLGKTMVSKVGGAASKVAGKLTGKMGGFAGKALGKLTGKGAASVASVGGGDATSKMLDTQAGNLDKSSKLADGAKSMGDKIADFGKGLGSAIKSIGTGIGGAIEGILTGLGNGLKSLGIALSTPTPMGTVAIAVGLFFLALGASLYLAAPAIKAIAPVLMKFVEIIGVALVKALEVAGPIIQKVIETVGVVLTAFMPVLIRVAEVLGTVFIAAIKEIGPIVKTVFEGIASVMSTIGTQIVNIINTIGDNIVKIVDKLMAITGINPLTLMAIAAGIVILGGALAGFGAGSGAGAFADGLGKLVGGDSPIDQLIKILDKVDPKTIGAVVAGIAGIGVAMKVMADNLGNIDSSKLEEFGDALSGLMKNMSGGLMDGLSSLAGGKSPLESMNQLVTGLNPEKISGAAKAFGQIADSLKKLSDTISTLDVDKLSAVMDKVGGGAGGAVSKVVGSIMGGVTSLFGGGGTEEKKSTQNPLDAAVGGMVSSLFGGGESKPKSAADKASEYTATKATSITSIPQTTTPTTTASSISSIPQTTTPTTTAAPPGANANLAPGGAVGKAKGGDGDGLGAKLDKLISIMESMATQPTIIKFGEKTVEEIQGKIDFKKAYNIAIDNTYGRRI